MAAETFSLQAYLERVKGGLTEGLRRQCKLLGDVLPANLDTLTALMQAQSEAISFENMDVVLGNTISMAADDVYKKMVLQKRGGYCFEHNTLLQSALLACDFQVAPMLTRVRWGKKPDEDTAYTHIVLVVNGTDFKNYLADVGFACVNSCKPIALGKDGEIQSQVDGNYRTATAGGYTALEVQDRNDAPAWHALYKWRVDRWETMPDFWQANWFSCTFPAARFTNQFFVARVLDAKPLPGSPTTGNNKDKIHLLNNTFVRRSMSTGEVVESRTVGSVNELVKILADEFDLEIESCEKLGRYI